MKSVPTYLWWSLNYILLLNQKSLQLGQSCHQAYRTSRSDFFCRIMHIIMRIYFKYFVREIPTRQLQIETFELDLLPSHTIDEVKDRICQAIGVPVVILRLIFAGKGHPCPINWLWWANFKLKFQDRLKTDRRAEFSHGFLPCRVERRVDQMTSKVVYFPVLFEYEINGIKLWWVNVLLLSHPLSVSLSSSLIILLSSSLSCRFKRYGEECWNHFHIRHSNHFLHYKTRFYR